MFCSKQIDFRRLQKNSDITDQAEFHYKDYSQHKAISTLLHSNICVSQILGVVIETSNVVVLIMGLQWYYKNMC